MDKPRVSKQIIILRKDLNMRKGKMVAQGSHASLAAYKIARKQLTLWVRFKLLLRFLHIPVRISESVLAFLDWDNGKFTKVTVSVNSEQELFDIYYKAHHAGLTSVHITDEGLTEFKGVKTNTAVAIGPAWSDELQPITGTLQLL